MIRLGLAPPRLALLSLDLHCAMQLLPIAIQPLGSSPARSLPKQAFNGLRQQTVCTEIPIASNAPPCHTSRGFLPWRFAYAGPRVRRTTFTGPASANLHNGRLMHRIKRRLYSITSSARADNVGGTSRPSTFAVFRLRTNSNLVD